MALARARAGLSSRPSSRWFTRLSEGILAVANEPLEEGGDRPDEGQEDRREDDVEAGVRVGDRPRRIGAEEGEMVRPEAEGGKADESAGGAEEQVAEEHALRRRRRAQGEPEGNEPRADVGAEDEGEREG